MSGIFKNRIKKALALLMCTGFILGSASILGYRPVKAFAQLFLGNGLPFNAKDGTHK